MVRAVHKRAVIIWSILRAGRWIIVTPILFELGPKHMIAKSGKRYDGTGIENNIWVNSVVMGCSRGSFLVPSNLTYFKLSNQKVY